MIENRHAFIPILTGMVASHLFFTCWLYLSNLSIYDQLTGVVAAGYLCVPNGHVMPSLHWVSSAFIGAFFFTLTIGITHSVLACFLAKLWRGPFDRSGLFLKILILGLVLCLFLMNQNGLNFLFSLWFIGVFLLVFKCTTALGGAPSAQFSIQALRYHLPLLVLLVIFFSIPSKENIFIKIRDQVLFPNDLGRKAIDLYYRYTLYPAEAVKSFNQKLFCACRLYNFQGNQQDTAVIAKLVSNNYLPITNHDSPVDVSIHNMGKELYFTVNGRVVLKENPRRFLTHATKVLNTLSRKTDRHLFLRRIVAVSLLLGLPLVAYGLLFWGLHRLASHFFSSNNWSLFLSALGCLLVLIVFYYGVSITSPKPVPVKRLTTVLSSRNWKTRINGLQTIVNLQLEVMNYRDPSYAINSPYPLERMWVARALGNSRSPQTFDLLWTLVDDPHPNVACMALNSIGKRGDRGAVLPVIHWIKNSTHWYAQWYAYQTLKMLQWQQEELK